MYRTITAELPMGYGLHLRNMDGIIQCSTNKLENQYTIKMDSSKRKGNKMDWEHINIGKKETTTPSSRNNIKKSVIQFFMFPHVDKPKSSNTDDIVHKDKITITISEEVALKRGPHLWVTTIATSPGSWIYKLYDQSWYQTRTFLGSLKLDVEQNSNEPQEDLSGNLLESEVKVGSSSDRPTINALVGDTIAIPINLNQINKDKLNLKLVKTRR